MKIKMFVYLKELKSKVNRKIVISDDMGLKQFCERVIVSMNGNGKHLYKLIVNECYAFLGSGNIENSFNDERLMDNDDTISDLCLDVDYELMLNYDFSCA